MVSDNLKGILLSIGCAVAWGISYTSLQPASAKLRPETVAAFYGLSLFLANAIYLVAGGNTSDILNFKGDYTWGYFMGYAVFSIIASFLFLSGYKLVGGSYAGPFVAISTTYSIINWLLTYLFYGQKDYKLEFVIPGMLLTTIGVVLLCLGK